MTNAIWQKYHSTIIYKLRLKSFFKLHSTEDINDRLQSLVIIPYPLLLPLPLPPGKMQDIKTGPSKETLHSEPPSPLRKKYDENVTISSWSFITPFALEAFSWPQKLPLIEHQSAGQEDILGQETYSSVYKTGARNLNVFIFEHEVKQQSRSWYNAVKPLPGLL